VKLEGLLFVGAAALGFIVPGCADVFNISTTRYLAPPSERPCHGKLRVRVLYDMTGSTREVGVTAGKGVVDHLLSIDAAGGLRGCPIDVQVADTAYDVPVTLSAYRAWSAAPEWREVSTIFSQGTPMTQALAPLAAQDGKLVVTTAFNGELASPRPIQHDIGVPHLSSNFDEATIPVTKRSPGYPAVFFQATDYTTAARIAMSFAWKNGAKRVGFFACTKSAFCTDPVDGAKTFLAGLGGVKLGRDLAIELDDDEATIAKKVKAYFDAERAHAALDPSYVTVDWIWFGNTRATLAHVGRALKALQSSGAAVSLIADNWALDENLFRDCGEACIGFYGVQPYPIFGDLATPGMARLLEVHAEGRRRDGAPADSYASVQYVYGYVAVAAWRAAIEGALDAGEEVTAGAISRSFEHLQQHSVDGLANISYSDADHRPQATARVYVVRPTGKLEPIGQAASVALQADWLGW
jgi:ABC-type branched-subunit amino acid transport system substrate-binding protein